MRILVLGAGGIGGYYGGRLAESGADVTFLVREKRKVQLDAEGLRITSQYGDATIKVRSALAAQLEPRYDCAIIACKAYDLGTAIDAVAPGLNAEGFILPELNGLAHIERLNQRFSQARVLGGTAKIQVTLTPEGVVKHLNDWCFLTFGEQNSVMSPRVQQLAALFDKARGVKAKAVPNAMQEMWEKLVHLSVSASMTCLMRAPVGDILRTPYGQELFMRMLESAEAVATHHGYPPRPEYKKWCRELFSQPDSLYGTSMLRDIERGGPTEGEHIVGDMVRRAQAAGVDDTLFRIAYTHLKAYENRRAAGRL